LRVAGAGYIPLSQGVTRVVIVTLGALGIGWSCLTLPTFLNEYPIGQFAARIQRGDSFPAERLQEQLSRFRAGIHLTDCSASAAHSSAVVDFTSVRADADSLDAQIEAARRSVVTGLSCVPSDGYLWFALFQVESLQSGLREEYISHLAMSYKVNPNEAWLAIPRNRAAFAIYPALSNDLKSKVLDEFCQLVRTGLYWNAIDIFLGSAQPYQDALVKHMEKLPVRDRQLFAVALARKGVDARIPGTSVVVRDWLH
jgi:hypothetical protein